MQTWFSVAPRDELWAAPWTHKKRINSYETTRLTESGVTVVLSKCKFQEVHFSHSCEACDQNPIFLYGLETHLKPIWEICKHITVPNSSRHWKLTYSLPQVLCHVICAMLFVWCGTDPLLHLSGKSFWDSTFLPLTPQRQDESVVFFPSKSTASEETLAEFSMCILGTQSNLQRLEMSLCFGCSFWGCIQVQA